MKTLTLIISIMTMITFNSLGQETDIKGLLEKPSTRTEIFNTIMNSHGLMTDFMKAANGNEHAMMMMKENNQMMMGQDGKMEMKDEHQMMGMMKDNPEMMQKMMSNMIDMCEKDTAMQSKMAGTMAQHPEMMKMCMQKMQENGMMGKDGNMKMMNSEGKTGDNKHSHQH